MRIIVTGGAGFIGSHIVDAYVKLGHRVAVIDNLRTGSRANLNSKAIFYKADITNGKSMLSIFKRERPQIVNHHAAMVSVAESIKNPSSALSINVAGTANVLQAFAAFGAKNGKFIFASTGGAIYGKSKKIPANEETPTNPLSPYGLSKLLAEEVIRFYGRTENINFTILRYTNVYGPRQSGKSEAGIVPIFSSLMRHGKKPVIFGDGTKSRDYLYVSDAVRANVLALKKGKNETLNLGWGKTITDQEMFDAIAREMKFKKPPKYAPFRKGEVYKISLDAKKAKKILGWKPKVKLEEGIKRTLE